MVRAALRRLCVRILWLAIPCCAVAALGLSGQQDPQAPTRGVKSAAEIDREWQAAVAKYDGARATILKDVDRQAHEGPYRPDWESLRKFEIPQWYKDAKFGVFIHWGVFSVPGIGNEWYPRNMYQQKEPEFQQHIQKYGPQDKVGYKDLIPLFRAEKWDPGDWAELFKAAGARYVIPVAEHHDGFAMYDSALSDWSAAKMGPRRDVIGELAAAVRAQGLHFGTSFHRAEHDWFFDGGRTFRSDVNDPRYAALYGPAHTWLQDPHQALIRSLGSKAMSPRLLIGRVELLGSSAKLDWRQTEDALEVKLPDSFPGKYAYVFRIQIGMAEDPR